MQKRELGDVLYEICRAACVKDFERVLEQRGQLVVDLEEAWDLVPLPYQLLFEYMYVKEPSVELVDRFESRVQSLDQLIKLAVSCSRILSSLRDNLRLKLISLEPRVGETEDQEESALRKQDGSL